jgi:hypothetical protein
MPHTIVVQAFLQALSAGGAVILAEVAARTPERDEGERNEDQIHLIEALTYETELDTNGQGGRVRIGFGREGRRAMWVEYGHRLMSHNPDEKEIGTVPAHPFMRPAADAAADAAIEAFRATLESELKGLP